jgi:uncharacterized protein YjiS (DUF1127 family)
MMTRSALSVTTFLGSTVLRAPAHWVSNLVKAFKDRREIRHLAEFDDRMLKDIGLTRNDVDSALAEPIFNHPSRVLVRCDGRHSRTERTASPACALRSTVPIVTQNERLV